MNVLSEQVKISNSRSDVISAIKKIVQSETQDESFFFCDVGDILGKYRMWTSALPNIEPHYAVKANDSDVVLELLSTLGTGFDCASKGEIAKILSLGVKPERIIYANPIKPVSHILYAKSVGVKAMTFDSELELHKIKELYPDAHMVLRFKADDKQAKYKLGRKFGCDAEVEAPHLLRVAKSLNINVIGVAFHVGSGSKNADAYSKAIAKAKQIFDFAFEIGYEFHLLDVGGGFPGEIGTNLDKISTSINASLDKYFKGIPIRIISEPGRYFVNSAFTLVTHIHYSSKILEENPITKNEYTKQILFVNTSVYSCLNEAINLDKYYPKPLMIRSDSPKYPTRLWGCSCDATDIICDDEILQELQFGEWIIFENVGAYTLAKASKWNGFFIPEVYGFINENTWLTLKTYQPETANIFVTNEAPSNMIQLSSRGKEKLSILA